jgi:hypothetical protein
MRVRAVPAVLVLAAAVAACAKKDDKGADNTAQERVQPAVVTVTASEYSFAAPDTIASGLTAIKLVNTGAEPHHISMFRLDSAKTIADMQALKESDPPPAWLVAVGGPNAAMPGDSIRAIMDLEPGNYLMMCFIPAADGQPHMAKGMMRPITVIPATGPTAEEPKADLTINLVDYGFEMSAPITAGRHMIRVNNNGPQDHEMVLVKLAPGKTGQDFLNWTNDMKSGPPPGSVMNGIAGMKAGLHAYVGNTFEAGNYALVCFVPDIKDGKPHFMHGMAKDFTVS